MKKILLLLIIFFGLLSISYANLKVVSLAPAFTDIVIDLNKGKTLKGVTDFCRLPPKLKDKVTRIGSAINPSYEEIIKIQPDLVLLYKENKKVISFLESNDINYEAYNHKNIKDIFNTVVEISSEFNIKQKGKKLVENAREKLHSLKEKTKNYKLKSVLVIIGRQLNGFENIYIAGNNEFITQILGYLHLRNAYGGNINYPRVSLEGIIKMNPDIIIEVLPNLVRKYGVKKIKDDWKKIKYLSAVKNKNIYVMGKEFRIIPSLDIVNIAKRFYEMIYDSKN